MDPSQHRRQRQAARGHAGEDHGHGAAPPPGTGGAMIESAVHAAGGVVWRLVEGKPRVLLIHRTKYRDVTLPKGKVDPGEMLAETAVREIQIGRAHSELQSLMRISYAVFCLNKKIHN